MSTKAPSIKELQEAVLNMDTYSQENFSKIQGIASLALKALEAPRNEPLNSYQLESFANGFEAIQYLAQDAENLINCTAEDVGCNYKNMPMYRRTGILEDMKKIQAT